MPECTVVDIDALTPDPANARHHGEENRRAIRASLTRFGAGRSIVLDGSNVVRAGNGTLEAARAEGIREVILIEPRPDQLVAVKRPDWSESQAAAYAIADNRAGETASWQELILAQTLDRLPQEDRAATGFSETEITAMLERLATHAAGPLGSESDPSSDPAGNGTDNRANPSPDGPPATPTTNPPAASPEQRHAELVAKWRTAPGQVWTIPSVTTPGQSHRVVCGDCRDASTVRLALGGKLANGIVTSPPYAEQRKTQYGGIPADQYVEWFGSVQAPWRDVLTPDGSVLINIKEHAEGGQRHLYVKRLTIAMVDQWGWNYVDEFAWLRRGAPGSWPNRFKNGWEPVFHFAMGRQIKFRPDNVLVPSAIALGKHRPNKQEWGGFKDSGFTSFDDDALEARPSNVLDFKETISGLAHSAPYPVRLPEFFIQAFSDPGDTWLDPFVGAGTTVLAAERTGRLAAGIELRPEHVAVILQRLSDAGLSPALDFQPGQD